MRVKMLLSVVGVAILGLIGFLVVKGSNKPHASEVGAVTQPNFEPGVVLVKLRHEAGKQLEKSIASNSVRSDGGGSTLTPMLLKAGVSKVESVTFEADAPTIRAKYPDRSKNISQDSNNVNLDNIYQIHISNTADVQQTALEFARNPNVLYAQPNYIAKTQWEPNDPYYSSKGSWGQNQDDLWGLKKMQMSKAWDITKGSGVVVAVVDTGVDYTHPDLAGNIWTNSKEIPANGIDDDHNGYVDDVRGWNFDGKNNNPMDGYGHGTHVAGTIAAVGNNNLGIVGIAPEAKIMPVRALSDTGFGYISDLAKGIIYAAANGADVINNSWGCGGVCPSNPIAEDAVKFANSLGAVTVFAAGNSASDVNRISPQNMTDPKPIVVAATDPMDQPAYFSNFGPEVDVAAPGAGTKDAPPDYQPIRGVLSLKSSICNTDLCDPQLLVGDNYVRQAGTSMAAPHAAGVAALVLAHHQTFSPDQVRQVLRISSDDVNSPGLDLQTGAGRLNAYQALLIDAVPQVQITSPKNNTSAYLTDGQVTIKGTAKGANFAKYELSYAPRANSATWKVIQTGTSQVDNGDLGIWNTAGLAPEIFILRLSVITTAGKRIDTLNYLTVERYISKKVSSSGAVAWSPKIDNNRMVWVDGRDSHWVVYLYDFATKTERQISPSNSDATTATIAGDWVAWVDDRNNNYDIYTYNIKTNTEKRITSDPNAHDHPAISGNNLVYYDWKWGQSYSSNIYLYDLTTSTTRKLTSNDDGRSAPEISGNRVIWSAISRSGPWAGSWGLQLYDLTTNTVSLVPTSSQQAIEAKISGDNIVYTGWTAYPSNSDGSYNNNEDIYYYNIPTNTERQITNAMTWQFRPSISDRYITYEELTNGNEDVALYDLQANTTKLISINTSEQVVPFVSGSRVAWTDLRDGGTSIFAYDISPTSILAPIGNQSIEKNKTLKLTIKAADAALNPATFAVSSLPSGATFDTAKHIFSWKPSSYNQVGTYELTFGLSSGIKIGDAETVTISVINVASKVTSFKVSPDPFSPNGDGMKDTAKITGSWTLPSNWNLIIATLGNNPVIVKTLTGTGTKVSYVWDGKKDDGSKAADGSYGVNLYLTSPGETDRGQASVGLDTSIPIVTKLGGQPPEFCQAGTTIGYKNSNEPSDTGTFYYLATLDVYDSNGTLVKTLYKNKKISAGSGDSGDDVYWNGKNAAGALAPIGTYTIKLWVEDAAGNKTSPYPAIGTVKRQC